MSTLRGENRKRATFWFANGRAGMPVRVEEWVGGELVSRLVVIEDGVA